MQTTRPIRLGEDAPPVGLERACKTCFHFQVCGIAQGVARAFKTEEGQPPSPIDGQDLAKICTAYTALTGVLTA